MQTVRTIALRNRVVRATVAAAHVFVLLAVLNEHLVPPPAPPAADAPLQIRILRPPPSAAGAVRPARATTLPPPPQQPPPVAPAASPTAIDPAATGASHIDWAHEAERVARTTHTPAPPPRTDCEDTDRPGAMKPRCTPRHLSFGWGHEPRTVEFDGGLPFVRLGKRCLIGLGFFGCAIGKLPDANGHLFDERNAADRPTSSVPDLPGARP